VRIWQVVETREGIISVVPGSIDEIWGLAVVKRQMFERGLHCNGERLGLRGETKVK
jgi:hypothetical protein